MAFCSLPGCHSMIHGRSRVKLLRIVVQEDDDMT